MSEKFYIANLSFLLNYNPSKNDSIEYDLYRILFQVRGLTHYARSSGGSFEDLEQENDVNFLQLKFIINILESIYELNQSRAFNPYIVVSYNDIEIDRTKGYRVNIKYRILQDLTKEGEIIQVF